MILKRILFYILISLGLYVGAAQADSGPVKQLKEINRLIEAYKDTEALLKCQEVLTIDSAHYEVLCKTSLLHSRIGNRYTDETRKAFHFSEAKKYAEKALKIKPSGAEANYQMALAVSNLATTADAKGRIAALTDIKNYLDAALQANPKHAGAWHLMGRWQFRAANINLAEAAAANLLLGGVPQGASNEQAIVALRQAIMFDPENLIYYYDLARIYKELKDETACKAILSEAMCIQPATNEDLELNRRCKMLLAKVER